MMTEHFYLSTKNGFWHMPYCSWFWICGLKADTTNELLCLQTMHWSSTKDTKHSKWLIYAGDGYDWDLVYQRMSFLYFMMEGQNWPR